MYQYKSYELDFKGMSALESAQLGLKASKALQAYSEGCTMLGFNDDTRPSFEFVEPAPAHQKVGIRVKSAEPLQGSYHPVSNRIAICLKEAENPAATVLHELYHAYLKQKGERLEHYAEEDACEAFAAQAMDRIFLEKYEPVDQRPEEELQQDGWTIYQIGYERFKAYRNDDKLFVYDHWGQLFDIKSVQWDFWAGREVAI